MFFSKLFITNKQQKLSQKKNDEIYVGPNIVSQFKLMSCFTPQQLDIWHRRQQRQTYTEICTNKNISPKSLSKCLKRTALGYHWDPQLKGGPTPYLCQEDEQSLYDILQSHIDDNNCLRCFEVQDTAHYLKALRIQTAILKLNEIGSAELASSLDPNPSPPSRTWVNDFVIRYGMAIRSSVEIEKNRISGGLKNVIMRLLMEHAHKISGRNPNEIFNADETMLSSKRVFKAITNREIFHAVTDSVPSFTHMTAMVTICAGGEKVPPMLILSNLQNLPTNLNSFKTFAWWGSSTSGWMTKSLFTSWCVNFAHWSTKYRERLNTNSRFMLLMDGHLSRMNASAMHYLFIHGIDVIILPAHSSHITQPFDVGIASSLKCKYKKYLIKFIREIPEGTLMGTDLSRLLGVSAFFEALSTVCSPLMQRKAFETTGICPFEPNNMLASPFVRDGDVSLCQQNRYSLNGKEITNPESILEMRNFQITSGDRNPFHVDIIDPVQLQNYMLGATQREGRLLNKLESKCESMNGFLVIKRFV